MGVVEEEGRGEEKSFWREWRCGRGGKGWGGKGREKKKRGKVKRDSLNTDVGWAGGEEEKKRKRRSTCCVSATQARKVGDRIRCA